MRPDFKFTFVAVLLSGCAVYDAGLLAEAVGGDGGSPGDGDGAGDGDGDGDDPGDGDIGTGSGGTDAVGGTFGSGGMNASGGSGSSSSGGAGSGGSGTGGVSNTGGLESTFDDFDAGNAWTITVTDGRFGDWQVYNDGTAEATMTPTPGQAFVTSERSDDPGNEALRVTALGFTDWGAGVYAPFKDDGMPETALEPYDVVARGYDAVRLWAKKETATAEETLRIAIADDASTPSPDGSCPVAPQVTCAFDHATVEIVLTTDWQEYTIALSEFSRSSTIDPVDFSGALQLHLNQDSADIDFWVDDIRLVDFDQ